MKTISLSVTVLLLFIVTSCSTGNKVTFKDIKEL